MRWAVYILILASAVSAQTVEGTIVNTATGRGIPEAHVALYKGGDRVSQQLYSAVADANGHFVIENVKEGVYSPRYTADRFSPADGIPVGADFNVAGATSRVQIEGRLAPNPQITGRVIDGRGAPVPKAQVDLTTGQAFWSVATDSQGRFELNSVIPSFADYRLSASPPSGWKPPDKDADFPQPRAWARTFYPAALRYEEAPPLKMLPGLNVPDLEIRLLAVDVHAVRGVLISPGDEKASGVSVALSVAGPNRPAAYTVVSGSDGAFEFPAVAEGAWRITSTNGNLRMEQWLDVNHRDLDLGKLPLSPPFTLRGRILVEAPEGQPAPKLPAILLIPQHAAQLTFSSATRGTVPFADGRLEFANMYAGDYLFVPTDAVPPYFVDSIRMGDTAITGEVSLSVSSPEVVIVYKKNGGTVSGKVENCGTGMVWLLATSGLDWALRSGRCDTEGKFEVAGVRPGEYHALATPVGLQLTRETAGPWLGSALRITVRAGEITQAELKVSAWR